MSGINTLSYDIREQVRTTLANSSDIQAITTKILKGRPTRLGKQGYSRVEVHTPNMKEIRLTQGNSPVYAITATVSLTCVTRKAETSPVLMDAVKKAIRDNQNTFKAMGFHNLQFNETSTDEIEIDDKTTEYHTDVILEWIVRAN